MAWQLSCCAVCKIVTQLEHLKYDYMHLAGAFEIELVYRKTSGISRALVGNKIVGNSDVVGASPVGAAPTTSSFST